MIAKKLNSILLLAVFFLLSNFSYAQIVKFKSTGLAYKYVQDDETWTSWSDFQETSVLISIDTDKERITIYSKETQVYDITENEGKETDDDGDDFWSYLCVNEAGLSCRVRLVKLNSQNGRNQLYIDFNDMKWVYNMYPM